MNTQPGRFHTTQWSLILAAGQQNSPEALARLCSLYWYPVFAFVRRQTRNAEDAQDLTQGFFARLIEKNDIAAADRDRGRFRSFLLTSCQHFLANERDRAQAAKRGGGLTPIPIDVAAAESRYERALSHDDTPERLYDRQWSLTLLATVLDRLKSEFADDRVFTRLSVFLTDTDDTHAAAARDLGMTPGAVKVAVHRLRRRYRDALRRYVADTVASEADVDDEIRYLLDRVG